MENEFASDSDKVASRVELLKSLDFLKEASVDELVRIAEIAQEQIYAPNQVIIEQGQLPNFFYILVSGRVWVWQNQDKGMEELVNERKAVDYFGEAALLTGNRRNATCQAITQVRVLMVDQPNFALLLQPYFLRLAEQKRFQANLAILRRNKNFISLPIALLEKIAGLAHQHFYEKDELVIGPGKSGREFFIVESGLIRLFQLDGQPRPLGFRKPGDFFGDVAILRDMPVHTVARAVQTSLLLVIPQDERYQALLEPITVRRMLQNLARQYQVAT